MPLRMTKRQLEALIAGKPMPRASKYGAVPTTLNGVRYASGAEANRAAELDILIAAHNIKSYTRQPRFELGVPENVYIADFAVIGNDDEEWIEDVKGKQTAKFRRDVKLWRAYGPKPLHIIDKKGTTVIPRGTKL